MKRSLITVLAFLAIAGLLLWQGFRGEEEVKPRFDLSDVQQLLIERGDHRIALERSGQGWRLEGDGKADGAAVERLLNDLATMQIVRKVSDDPKDFKRLGLAERAVHVFVRGKSGPLMDIDIGETAGDLSTTYVRFRGEGAVAVDKLLVWQVRRTRKAWALKRDDE